MTKKGWRHIFRGLKKIWRKHCSLVFGTLLVHSVRPPNRDLKPKIHCQWLRINARCKSYFSNKMYFLATNRREKNHNKISSGSGVESFIFCKLFSFVSIHTKSILFWQRFFVFLLKRGEGTKKRCKMQHSKFG